MPISDWNFGEKDSVNLHKFNFNVKILNANLLFNASDKLWSSATFDLRMLIKSSSFFV